MKTQSSQQPDNTAATIALLAKLFDRHDKDGAVALNRFQANLAAASLSFDVVANVRERVFSPQAGFPQGMPSFIYYHIQGTRFGRAKAPPSRAEDPAHAISSDGIGLKDCFFFSAGVPIYLEVKYRPTDWMRVTDLGEQVIDEQFFGDRWN